MLHKCRQILLLPKLGFWKLLMRKNRWTPFTISTFKLHRVKAFKIGIVHLVKNHQNCQSILFIHFFCSAKSEETENQFEIGNSIHLSSYILLKRMCVLIVSHGNQSIAVSIYKLNRKGWLMFYFKLKWVCDYENDSIYENSLQCYTR